jgi:hypothetical protein
MLDTSLRACLSKINLISLSINNYKRINQLCS